MLFRIALRGLALAALGLVAVLPACGESPPEVPPGSCPTTIWYAPKSASASANVSVVGDFNGWARPGTPLEATTTPGYMATRVYWTPGEQRYALLVDGAMLLDETVGTTSFHDKQEVSWQNVRDCRLPQIRVERTDTAKTSATFALAFDKGLEGAEVSFESMKLLGDDGAPLGQPHALTATTHGAMLSLSALPPGKTRVRIAAQDKSGHALPDVLVTAWTEDVPFDPKDAVVYQVMVDRFEGSGGALSAPASAGGRAGGTFVGLRNAIDRGDFDRLGVNVLWLSPVYKNPEGTFPGTDGNLYSSYHGYWPIDPRDVDPRLGTRDELKAVIRAAHARGIRVVFDVVPNHVHQEHPYASRPKWVQGTPGQCTCGTSTCPWAGHIDDCWFAPYMPDLDWKDQELARQEASDIVYWLEEYNADGIRIDAVPMAPRSASRRIAADVRARFQHAGNKVWIIGENFTGPAIAPDEKNVKAAAEGSFGLLRYYLGPFGLDTEFDFPLMWALRSAIAEGASGMNDLADMVRAGQTAYAGSGATMGLMIGNHDVSRFATVTAGDGNGDGWTPAPWPTESKTYAKQALALSIILALPGAPFLYYGDELALPGHADPDSRRVMPSAASWSALSRGVHENVAKASNLRRCSAELRRGTYRLLFADREHWVFSRDLAAGSALVYVSREPAVIAPLEVPLPGLQEGTYIDADSSETLDVRQSLTKLPPASLTVRVFLPREHPCLSR